MTDEQTKQAQAIIRVQLETINNQNAQIIGYKADLMVKKQLIEELQAQSAPPLPIEDDKAA